MTEAITYVQIGNGTQALVLGDDKMESPRSWLPNPAFQPSVTYFRDLGFNEVLIQRPHQMGLIGPFRNLRLIKVFTCPWND